MSKSKGSLVDFNTAKKSVTTAQFLGDYDLEATLRDKGDGFLGVFPIHNEESEHHIEKLVTQKTYEGRRKDNAAIVTVDGRPLNPRLDLWNHGSTGFEWGYGGNGPAQLALAILADCLGNDDQAVQLHQQFKLEVVRQLPHEAWTLTMAEIDEMLQRLTD